MRVIRVEYDAQVNQRRCDGVVNCEEVEMLTDTTGRPVISVSGSFQEFFQVGVALANESKLAVDCKKEAGLKQIK